MANDSRRYSRETDSISNHLEVSWVWKILKKRIQEQLQMQKMRRSVKIRRC